MQQKIKLPENGEYTIKDGYIIFEDNVCKFKAGDVLASKFTNDIVIFKESRFNVFSSYWDSSYKEEFSEWNVSAFDYATPEQQNMLLAKMQEHGVTFDFKTLKVIPYKWRPTRGDSYFRITMPTVEHFIYTGTDIDKVYLKNNNVFRTRTDADNVLDKCKEAVNNVLNLENNRL
jgi:hypothetical protein